MATIYVGPTSAGAADGTSWANRYGSLNAAEDRPVAAGDTVYVGAGTYRETLTVDVSGSAGSPVTYIGDYTGAATDGTGGVVRITGSDNDQTATRANFVVANSKDYRTFDGFVCDIASSVGWNLTTVNNWRLDRLYISGSVGGIQFIGDCKSNTVARAAIIGLTTGGGPILFLDAATERSDTANMVENCLGLNGRDGGIFLQSVRVGGITVRNSTIILSSSGFNVSALAVGQTVTVNNCIIAWCNYAFIAGAAGMVTENYNTVYAVSSPRTNVTAGANSNTYPPLFDARWFFEAVNGGNMLTPFDLASYSQLVNLAGTSPTTTDMRGTSVIGAQREWGPLEYDPALLIEAGSGGGGPVVGSRIIRGLGAL